MLLIPAIDLKQGKCVRLCQGRMNEETVYSEDPVAMAHHWVSSGARRMHLVDLDGAATGRPVNRQVIHDIVQACPDIVIEIGGGIRDDDSALSYLEAGARYVVIGTQAVSAPHFVSDLCLEFPGRIIVGLDARDGKVAVDGWSKLSNHDVVDMAQHFEKDGVAAIVYTDISRDGMMSGINIEATVALAQAVSIPVIASGGIATVEDIRALCMVAGEGIIGAITGRAIYEGSLDYGAGQQLADELCGRQQQ